MKEPKKLSKQQVGKSGQMVKPTITWMNSHFLNSKTQKNGLEGVGEGGGDEREGKKYKWDYILEEKHPKTSTNWIEFGHNKSLRDHRNIKPAFYKQKHKHMHTTYR